MRLVKNFFGVHPSRYTEGEFGLEIEVEDPAGIYFNPNKYWTVTRDGSLDNGMEYVLAEPMSLEGCRKALAYFTRKKNESGMKIQDSIRCGVHVHVNVQDMVMTNLLNMITLYYVMENVFSRFWGESREGNLFCLRAKDAEYQIQVLSDFVAGENIRVLQSDDLRYAGMNLTSLSKFGSLEFRGLRTPSGRGAVTKIFDWLKILSDLRDASFNFENPQKIVENFSGNTIDDFLLDNFPNTKHILEKVEDIELLLYSGARQAQDIAYARQDWTSFYPQKSANPFRMEV
jgi:hypothetical protein